MSRSRTCSPTCTRSRRPVQSGHPCPLRCAQAQRLSGMSVYVIIASVPATKNSVLFRKLPSTDELLRLPDVQALADREGHAAVAESVRAVLARLRQEIADDHLDEKSLDLALSGL